MAGGGRPAPHCWMRCHSPPPRAWVGDWTGADMGAPWDSVAAAPPDPGDPRGHLSCVTPAPAEPWRGQGQAEEGRREELSCWLPGPPLQPAG